MYFLSSMYVLLSTFWNVLQASDEETYDLVREGVVIFTGALAKHLSKVQILSDCSLFKLNDTDTWY